MKITNTKIGNFLLKDFKVFCATLLYGPDIGLVSDRCELIIKQCINTQDKANISLNKIHIQYKDLCSEPSLLTDEITSLNFFTKSKVIIVENVEGNLIKSLEEILKHNKDHAIIFKAGDLPPTSSIRKLFETSKELASLPCYVDNTNSITQKILKLLQQHNIKLENTNVIYDIADILKGDYKTIESEINKVIIYCNNQPNVKVSSELIYSIVSKDYLLLEYEFLFNSIANRDVSKFKKLISNMISNGDNIISILRHISGFLLKLIKIKTISQNKHLSIDSSIKLSGIPIFFKQVPIFKKALSAYSISSLIQILESITSFEALSKQITLPQEVAQATLAKSVFI